MSRYQSVYERAARVAKAQLAQVGAPADEQDRERLLAFIRVEAGCSVRTSQAVLKDVLLVAPRGRQLKVST